LDGPVPAPRRTPSDVVDLSASVPVTTALLRDQRWRSRVVEEFEIDRATSCRDVRRLQIAPMGEFLAPFLDGREPRAVRVTLSGATLPKRPLVEFTLSGGYEDVFLLKRREIAERQAALLVALAGEAGVGTPAGVAAYLAAIGEFLPGQWERYRRRDPVIALRDYLRTGLGLDALPPAVFAEWVALAEEVAGWVRPAFPERPDPTSSADQPLLALPPLFSAADEVDLGAVTAAVHDLHGWVRACAGSTEVLRAFGRYGRRYEALVTCTVATDTPTSVRMSQEIPVELRHFRHADVEAVFRDAVSNHVAVRVLDPDVEIRLAGVHLPNGEPVSDTAFTVRHETREDVALSSSEDARPYRMVLRLTLRAATLTTLNSVGVAVLTLLAAVLVVTVRPLASDDVALLVVPATFASGLLLVQQRTTLAARLQVPWRTAAALSLLVLWLVVMVGLVTGSIRTG
jgi:hypothetical protein